MAKYEMILEAFGNIDHQENPKKKACNTRFVYKDSIAEMQSAFLDYITKNNLGSGNIQSANVIDLTTQCIVGCITYNGKFWKKGSKYCP